MTRFEIKGLKEPRGAGSGWETKQKAEDFCRKLATNSLWQSMFMAEGTKFADLEICEFDFQFNEPDVKIVRIERDEKELMPLYDDECNKVYYEVNKDDDEYYDTLQEYDPIWFTLSIDLKEGIMYADVDLSNGLGMVEVAREKLPDDEREFEKAVKRMIEAF